MGSSNGGLSNTSPTIPSTTTNYNSTPVEMNAFDALHGRSVSTNTIPNSSINTFPAWAGGSFPANANLGANLSTNNYNAQTLAGLPSNMPGGGGALAGQYTTPFASGSGTPWGINNMGTFQNYYGQPAGMYNPYLGHSSVMGVPGVVNNPYGGFNPDINSYATGVDNYLKQIRAPQYSTPEPTTDTSPGNPFAGQQVVHGNTADWQSAGGDYVGTPQEAYQAAPGMQVDQGISPSVAPTSGGISPSTDPRMRGGRRWGMQGREERGGNGYPSRYSPAVQEFLGRYAGPDTSQSQLGWDQHMLRQAMGPNNPAYMSPESAARLRRTIMTRNGLMQASPIWGR